MRPRHALVLALGALSAIPAAALAHGAEGSDARAAAEQLRADWLSAWSPSPLQMAPVLLALALYGLRARRLGARLPAWRAWCFAGGMLVLTLAVISPIDPVGERGLFSVHMLQHVLMGDIAALLIVLGVTGPVLRPALALRSVRRLRVLSHPFVALPLWTLSLLAWHVPALYEASLSNDVVHALEHISFVTFGCLMWSAVIEPLPGPEWFGTGWKIAYIGAVRVVQMILGNVLWFSGTVLYPTYRETAPAFGQTGLEDQVNAGTIMMVEGGLVTLAAALVLFFRLSREGELRQSLIERGVPAAAARRAVRYGRGEALAARHGLRPADGLATWDDPTGANAGATAAGARRGPVT